MKIELKRTDIVTNIDLGDRIEIQIQNSAKIVNLLTKNLYSQPWKSCVRELITNAIDANIAAGKNDTPIAIEFMPPDRTSLHGFVRIADSGNGMSPETIRNVLATLGVTTKDHSNDQHGGFGIGILSLFSVTSQAQLDTCFEGIRYRYLLVIDENGVPCLKLIDRAATQDFGTSITVPIGDNTSAQQAWDAISYYRPFIQPRPICTGAEFDGGFETLVYQNLLGKIDGDGFTYHVNPREPGCEVVVVVRIGQIIYDLEGDIYTNLVKSNRKKMPIARNWLSRNIGQSLVIDIPIGTLDLPSSRESISDTAKNKGIITAAIDEAISSCRVKIFDAMRDPAAAFGDMSLVDRVHFSRNWGIPVVEWNGLEIPIEYFFKQLDFFTNNDAWSYIDLSVKLQVQARQVIDLIAKHHANLNLFYIYIGKKDRLRSVIRVYNPEAFLSPIYIFAFETEADYLTWSEENRFLLALAPQSQIVRQKVRATKAAAIEATPIQKLEKWKSKPRGLYRIVLDRDFNIHNSNWRSIATPVTVFPQNCISTTAKYLESFNSVDLGEYRDLLGLLGIERTEIVVLTDSAFAWMALAIHNKDKSFDGFVDLQDYVDNQACNCLEKNTLLLADLKCLPLYDSHNYRYVDRYLQAKRADLNAIENCIFGSNSASTAIGTERMRLATIVFEESLKIGAVLSCAYQLKLSMVETLANRYEREDWVADPYLKKTLAYLFSGVLNDYPVLKFLPCFSLEWVRGEQDMDSFVQFVEGIDEFLPLPPLD